MKFCTFSLDTKFRPKLTPLNFWFKLTQKGYFRTKKMKITIEFYIFKLIQNLNFSFNKQFDISNKFPKKRILPADNRKKNITIELFIFELV